MVNEKRTFAWQAQLNTHRISDQLRAEVLEQVQLKVPSREILQRCRDKLLDQYMSEHQLQLTDRKAAIRAYCSSQPPRGWYLSMQDIANIRRNADKSIWRFDNDPQTSVKMSVAQNPEAVLYIDEQVPISGTPDHHEFMMNSCSPPTQPPVLKAAWVD